MTSVLFECVLRLSWATIGIVFSALVNFFSAASLRTGVFVQFSSFASVLEVTLLTCPDDEQPDDFVPELLNFLSQCLYLFIRFL